VVPSKKDTPAGTCIYCKKNTIYISAQTFVVEPTILLLQPNRYKFNHNTNTTTKDRRKIYLNREITLLNKTYSLEGWISHIGPSANSGHYYTMKRVLNNSFAKYDDSKPVHLYDFDVRYDIEEEEQSNCYIICYKANTITNTESTSKKQHNITIPAPESQISQKATKESVSATKNRIHSEAIATECTAYKHTRDHTEIQPSKNPTTNIMNNSKDAKPEYKPKEMYLLKKKLLQHQQKYNTRIYPLPLNNTRLAFTVRSKSLCTESKNSRKMPVHQTKTPSSKRR
jgi:hypothetical protein